MESYLYKNIATGTTTTVCATAGVLHSIVVNKTAAGTIAVNDGAAAAVAIIGTLKASIVEGTYLFDVAFSDSLEIVTGAASDITVCYIQTGS